MTDNSRLSLFRRSLPLFAIAALGACATTPVANDRSPVVPISGPGPVTEVTVTVHHKPEVRALLDRLRAHDDWLVQQQISICQIEAPPFKERRRAEEIVRRFRELGYENARLDSIGNVIVERAGDPGEPVVVLSAHLDTVFPEDTDVTVKQSGDTLRGPGIGDDCRGLAVLLAIARTMNETALPSMRGTLVFVGTVGEEG